MNEIPEGMKALRDAIVDATMDASPLTYDIEAMAIASALLAPDGPLWDLLRLVGQVALDWADDGPQFLNPERRTFVAEAYPCSERGLSEPVARACVAAALAAEVEQ